MKTKMKTRKRQQSDLERFAIELKTAWDALDECKVGLRTLRDEHLSEEMLRFYAMKSFFDGKVIKFFVDRRKYVRVKQLGNIRKMFSLKRKRR